jgi:hypothetical protein
MEEHTVRREERRKSGDARREKELNYARTLRESFVVC